MFPKFMLGYIVTVIEPKKLESVILHTKGWYRKVFETHPKMSRCDERPSSTLRSRRSSPTVHLAQLLNWCSSSSCPVSKAKNFSLTVGAELADSSPKNHEEQFLSFSVYLLKTVNRDKSRSTVFYAFDFKFQFQR